MKQHKPNLSIWELKLALKLVSRISFKIITQVYLNLAKETVIVEPAMTHQQKERLKGQQIIITTVSQIYILIKIITSITWAREDQLKEMKR